MLLNASNKLAVKCSRCGKYNITDINIFKLKNHSSICSECGHEMYRANIVKGELVLSVDCIACEKEHSYRFKLKEALERPLNIISCPLTGMEIAFLGNEASVDDIVKRYMEDMFELLSSLGIIETRVTKVVK